MGGSEFFTVLGIFKYLGVGFKEWTKFQDHGLGELSGSSRRTTGKKKESDEK